MAPLDISAPIEITALAKSADADFMSDMFKVPCPFYFASPNRQRCGNEPPVPAAGHAAGMLAENATPSDGEGRMRTHPAGSIYASAVPDVTNR
jgi:hypothetical protein